MEKRQKQVKEFCQAAGQDTPNKPVTEPDKEVKELRARLILEEALEFCEASGVDVYFHGQQVDFDKLEFIGIDKFDLVETIDAVADLNFVSNGTAAVYGVDLEEVEDEVFRSNMSKFIDGELDKETGKWVKGPNYSPPDLKSIIDKQC